MGTWEVELGNGKRKLGVDREFSTGNPEPGTGNGLNVFVQSTKKPVILRGRPADENFGVKDQGATFALLMVMVSTGTSPMPFLGEVGAAAMASTTSMPLVTLPNTA